MLYKLVNRYMMENLHTHGSDAAKVETQIAITNIKKRAVSTMEQTSCVINECTSDLSQAAKILKKKIIQYYYTG